MKENLRYGLPKDDAQAEACSLILPVTAKKLQHSYLQYLRWHHDLKTGQAHKKDMKTLNSVMEDDEMEYTEAAEADESKRKYLLNSLFDLEHTPRDTSTEGDNLTNEARKRTFYERLYTSSIKNIMKENLQRLTPYLLRRVRRESLRFVNALQFIIALNKGDDSIIFITDDFDLLRFTPVTRYTQGDFSGESIIHQQRFVGIILTYLYNAASSFE